MRITLVFAICVLILLAGLQMGSTDGRPSTELIGFASLPADTFADGPASGAFAGNGVRGKPVYPGQPVQGFSGILARGDGSYLVMADNGFGSQKNSVDFYLRVYAVRPDFRADGGGSGTVRIEEDFIQLRDPDRNVHFLIVNEHTDERLLTGGDLDIESIVQAQDGSFWFGDEFGPFLVHTDATGRVLSRPIELPDFREGRDTTKDFIRSPDSPFLIFPPSGVPSPANLPRSRGFEGLAISSDQTKLYALLEGAVAGESAQQLAIHEFDLTAERYTGNRWLYPLADATHHIGDMVAVNAREFLVIERDGRKGHGAQFKRIFRIDISAADANGILSKEEIADLLDIHDSNNLGGLGSQFRFPYECVEGIAVLDATTLVVINDNNYPNEGERSPGVRNANEFLILRISKPLDLATEMGDQ